MTIFVAIKPYVDVPVIIIQYTGGRYDNVDAPPPSVFMGVPPHALHYVVRVLHQHAPTCILLADEENYESDNADQK